MSNKNKIGKIEKTSLEKAIEHAYSKKGAIYEQGDFIFIVFSPLMTHTTKNEVEAVKAAEGIISTLHNHNKRFMNKIDFGIGINTGEIITFTLNGAEGHSIELESIVGTTANLVIKSDPINVELSEGEEEKIDLNGDGIFNILILSGLVSQGKLYFPWPLWSQHYYIKRISCLSSGTACIKTIINIIN